MVKTAILVSGGGTNLQSIIDANLFGEIKNCELTAVISSNPEAYAIERAQYAGIPVYIVDRSIFPNRQSFSKALLDKLIDLEIELVVCAGFKSILSHLLVKAFENRMINIHPSLIPAFCGPGFNGLRVHEAVLDYGVKVTGATAHFVTEVVDDGPIILQKAVEIYEDDTPQTLQRRVMEEAEWKILPEAISLFCQRRLVIEERIVRIMGSLDNES
ncbi:MAG: phosphoribosylglycinamide formyltransferase [Oscillospiraceae bacterium]|nr:phosphoribosylglycinamide formyltransferase [Oscillospiraceae bacterium]